MMIVACVGLSVACGSGDNNGSDGGNDATANDSSNPNDSGNPGDSGNKDTGAPSKANYGSVSFSESVSGNTDSYTATAGFYETPDSGASSGGCAGTQSGNCCYVPPSDGGTGTTTATAVGAGGITLKDGTTTIGTMTPTGATYTALTSVTTNTLKWQPGDTLNVSAAGDTVHPFSGNVAAAALFEAVNPALSLITPITITRSSDFTITWTAGTGAINLSLSALKVATSDGLLTCSSSTDTGTMTIPTALRLYFSASDAAVVRSSRVLSADASPDNATVTLESSTSVSGSAKFN